MPSTLVHVALAGLVAAGLLADRFGVRSLAVVLATVVVVDLDVFLGLVILGAHRAAFHTLLWPALAAVALAYDGRRERSLLAARFGPGARRVAWTTVAAVVLAAIGPDLATNGANLLYPVHDQFYTLDGSLKLSSKKGVVQTFVEDPGRGSTEDTQYYTGVDPRPAESGAETNSNPERVFPLVTSGTQLLIVVAGAVVTTARLVESRRA